MAYQIDTKEDYDRRLLRVIDALQSEFGLTDREVDVLIFNTSFDNDLLVLCGDPDYANYN